MAQLTIVRDKTAMSEVAAERITSLIERAIGTRGSAAISLTGGDTPDLLYQFLADAKRPWRGRIDWSRMHLFWGDERAVPPDDPRSNFGLADRLLIRHVPMPPTQLFRMRGELPASEAGRLYDQLLRARRAETAERLFDVMLLGIGENAHIASIFPDSPLFVRGPTGSAPHDTEGQTASGANLSSPQQLATGIFVPEISQWRITMTPPALLDSAAIIMIASGPAKADAIAAAIERRLDVARYPAQLLREAIDRVEWIIDADAAARLRDAPRA